MQKQCIYCPTEYTVPDGLQTQSRYGICDACRAAEYPAHTEAPGAAAVVELAALAGDDPGKVLERVSLRGAA